MSLLKFKNVSIAALVSFCLAFSLFLTGCAEEGTYEEGSSSSVVEVGQEAKGDRSAAEALIGQTSTKDEIEKAVGAGERYEMNSAGCDRGVYGCYFWYSNFCLFAKTYDKGQTMTVTRIDE